MSKAKILEIFQSVQGEGRRPHWFGIVRALGIVFGICLLMRTISECTNPPTANSILWTIWILSPTILALLLMIPWRIIHHKFIWSVMYGLLLTTFLLAVFIYIPNIVWAELHGALAGLDKLFLLTALVCLVLQFWVLWKTRP